MRPCVGDRVIILEPANRFARLSTEGVVAQVLTKSLRHPEGIKVRLVTGEIGWVQCVLSRPSGRPGPERERPYPSVSRPPLSLTSSW